MSTAVQFVLRFPAWRDAEADLEHDQDGGAAAHPAGGDRRGGGGAGRPPGQYSTVQYSTVQYSTVQEEQAGHQAGDMVWPVGYILGSTHIEFY